MVVDDGSGGWRSSGSVTIIMLSGGEGVVRNLTRRIGYITWWYDCDTACILNNTMVGGGGGSRLLY